jgi:hypothetical protein
MWVQVEQHQHLLAARVAMLEQAVISRQQLWFMLLVEVVE